MTNEEFDPKLKIIDCSKYNCDLWKFNGQAPCFTGNCPYEEEEEKKNVIKQE